MKKIIFLIASVFMAASCSVSEDYQMTLDEKLHQYDLWFINKQESQGVLIPFFEKSFTVSFSRGILYANINLVGIGNRANGIGFSSGYYTADDIFLRIHYKDQSYSFEVQQVGNNRIVLHDQFSNAKYVLEGYQRNNFDYNRVFRENLRLFLQEYEAWEKIDQRGGNPNPFDGENYLRFIPEGGDRFFFASQSPKGLMLPSIYWNYKDNYSVENQILTLIFEGTAQRFQIHLIDDATLELTHLNSGTIYVFRGVGNIIFTKNLSEIPVK